MPIARDAAGVAQQYQLGWMIAAGAWVPTFVLVGAAAPAVRRAIAGSAGGVRGQLAALTSGFVGVWRAALPCLVAAMAVVVGGLALVVPGLLLIVLFALAGASEERGLPAVLF